MTVVDLLTILEERGLQLKLRADGCTPAIIGDSRAATPTLMRVLEQHRELLIRHLGGCSQDPQAEDCQIDAEVSQYRGVLVARGDKGRPKAIVLGALPEDNLDQISQLWDWSAAHPGSDIAIERQTEAGEWVREKTWCSPDGAAKQTACARVA